MRSYRATHNLIAVSANTKETAINTEQTLDTTMLCALGDVINLSPRRESNAEECNGKEEPDTVYDLGNLAGCPLNFEKAQPQHFAFLLAYALGTISTAAAGTGYEHTITPIADDEDGDRSNPSFTAAQRFGDVVVKRRFASMFVDSFTATFSKDEWCKISGECKGTGKVADNVYEETVSAAENATELNLAENKIEGSTAAEQLENVQRVRVELTSGVWTEVAYSAVPATTPPADWVTLTAYSLGDYCKPTTPNSYWYKCTAAGTSGAAEPTWPTTLAGTVVDDTATWTCMPDNSPSKITITAPGAGAGSINYKILYINWEAYNAWMTFPSRVTETPLRVAQLTVNLGGKWSGSAFEGGREMDAEFLSAEWSFNNNTDVEFVPGAGDAYAARAFRNGRAQAIKLGREFREYILQQHIDDNDTFGVYLLAEGAVYDTPHKYQVEIIFPKVSVLTAPISVDGKRLAEAGDLLVLEDDTYGSVIAKVKNLQTTYAA